ncbi:MAG: DUF1996 domain-containing protein [Nocardioidaceae bacterium]
MPSSCPFKNAAGDNYLLRLVVTFPNCLQDSSPANLLNYSPYMTYAKDSGQLNDPYPLTCPDGYTPIPQLQVGVRWPLDQFPTTQIDGSKVYDLSHATLASDNMPLNDGTGNISGPNGTTAHADFMSGWTTAELTTLIQNCYHIAQPKNCGIIGGNGV